MLSDFWSIQDGGIDLITVGKHRIVLTLQKSHPIQSALYQAGLKARRFVRGEIKKYALTSDDESCTKGMGSLHRGCSGCMEQE